jgi:lipoyl(octanoyl) transferase
MLCHVEQLGRIEYAEALRMLRGKVAARKVGTISDTLLLVEHPHVYTLGRNARREHVLATRDQLEALGVEVFDTDRGGDVTYHGPGQLVGYPVLDLSEHRRDLAWYMRSLEEVLVGVAQEFGVQAGRQKGAAGVWVENEKLAAMGVHVSRWITSHGFALNVNTDLSYFDGIVPCGLRGKGVTSLEKLLGRAIEMDCVAEQVVKHFGKVFGLEMCLRTFLNDSITQSLSRSPAQSLNELR